MRPFSYLALSADYQGLFLASVIGAERPWPIRSVWRVNDLQGEKGVSVIFKELDCCNPGHWANYGTATAEMCSNYE